MQADVYGTSSAELLLLLTVVGQKELRSMGFGDVMLFFVVFFYLVVLVPPAGSDHTWFLFFFLPLLHKKMSCLP